MYHGDSPDFQHNGGPASRHTQHGGILVVYGPEPIERGSHRFMHKRSAYGEQIPIQREAAHERTIDGQLYSFHRTTSLEPQPSLTPSSPGAPARRCWGALVQIIRTNVSTYGAALKR